MEGQIGWEEYEEQMRFAGLRYGFAQLSASPHGVLPPQLPGYDGYRADRRSGARH